MATASAPAETSRLSFAKVAASPGTDSKVGAALNRAAVTMPNREPRKNETQLKKAVGIDGRDGADIQHSSTLADETMIIPTILAKSSTDRSEIGTGVKASKETDLTERKLLDAVKALEISPPISGLVVNGSGSADTRRRPFITDNFSEELLRRADSGSEMGTKPPSLDGKSITSGTTFALDEKESLRPDDSASVKASEDDDTFSGRGSIVAGSRMGSEAAARAYREYNPPDRRLMQPMAERQLQGVSTPQSGSSGPQALDDEKAAMIGPVIGPEGFNLFYRQTPDEKLLEALDSPKDRIFLLRLEQDVIEFVKDSKEPFIDFPPSNSFCRMLTHKLADYYHMTHQVDAGAVLGAVRIFRTPFCRLPPPLTSISNPPTTGSTPPPTLPAMKIMRRGGDGDTGPSPSKATSETGSDGKDKSQLAKEKLSREEREVLYNRARERIFGKEDKTGDGLEVEDGNEMSRSSSVSTKDRNGQGKRAKPKQRRDDSDSFDVRSQYTPIFQQPQVQAAAWAPPGPGQYAMSQQGFPMPGQVGYNPQMQQQYVPAPQYNPAMMQAGGVQTYPAMPSQQYAPQSQLHYTSHSAPITPYGPAAGHPQVPQTQWQQQPVFTASYQAQIPAAAPRSGPSSIPYAFGQLPSTVNPADPKSQHPIPGSFNRHAFNPKTQSFVPGAVGIPQSQPISLHGSPHRGSPNHGSPHLPYNAYTPPQQFGNMGYGMARQLSNSSTPSYHASPHLPHRSVMVQGMPQQHGLPQNTHMNHQQNMHGPPGSHLPNYGNPSTLPPKPPTGL